MKKTSTFLLLIACVGLSAIGAAKGNSIAVSPGVPALHFRENKGQVTDQYLEPRWDMDVQLSVGKGLNVFIGNGKIEYQWAKPIGGQKLPGRKGLRNAVEMEEPLLYELYRMDVSLIGANKKAKLVMEGEQSHCERYFQPWVNKNNSNLGVVARAFTKLTYKDIYPCIDWVFYFNAEGQLEHDFRVRPGGKVSDIRIKYAGAEQLGLNENGSLTARTPMGSITEKAPIAYEEEGRAVPARFALDQGVLSFVVDRYSGTLVIDPVIEWGSYFGGTANDAGSAITTDPWGNVYVCGITTSISRIASRGAHQDTFAGGNSDAFLSKWSGDGVLLWASYYGGAGHIDIPGAVVADSLGRVYMGGYTNSATGIATPGSYQALKAGSAARTDAFLVQFDSTGVRLWGSYMGGTQYESTNGTDGLAMAVGPDGSVYMAGTTLSNNFPVTSGAHQGTFGGASDVFITQWSSTGSLLKSSYYGGSGEDYVGGIASDMGGNVYLSGYTQSNIGIATLGSYQVNNAGGKDAFLVQFDKEGKRSWGTYLGGNDNDECYALALGQGKIVIGGATASTSGIASAGAFQVIADKAAEGFISCFDTSGALDWSTYYGGDGADVIWDLYFQKQGYLYASGFTLSTNHMATPGSIKEQVQDYDGFLTKFDLSGKRIWGTYLGGSGIEENTCLSGYQDKVYLTGTTQSADQIAYGSSYQASIGGGEDVMILCINDCFIPAQPDGISGPVSICAGSERLYHVANDSLAVSYLWILPEGWVGDSDSSAIKLKAGSTDGMLKVIAYSSCGGATDTQYLGIRVLPLPEPTIRKSGFILSTTKPFVSYQWQLEGKDITGATNPTYLAVADGNYTVRVTDAGNCSASSEAMPVSGTVSIEDKAAALNLNFYPNPANQYVFIQSSQPGWLQLSCIDGRSVEKKIELRQGNNRIDLGHASPGIYLLKVYTPSGSKIFKVVKE